MVEKGPGLFSRIQVKYRSPRYGGWGGRWGAVKYDEVRLRELEMKRLRDLDDSRQRELRTALMRALEF